MATESKYIWRFQSVENGRGIYSYANLGSELSWESDTHRPGPYSDTHKPTGRELGSLLNYKAHRYGFATVKAARAWFNSRAELAGCPSHLKLMAFRRSDCSQVFDGAKQTIFVPAHEGVDAEPVLTLPATGLWDHGIKALMELASGKREVVSH